MTKTHSRVFFGWPMVFALCALVSWGSGVAQAKVVAPAKVVGPQQMVENTTHELLSRLDKNRAELKAHPDKLYALVNDIVVPHFDFVHMSHWVLGRVNWAQMSNAQKTRFVLAFRTLLVRTYATALMQYQDQKIDFLPLRDNPASGQVEVRSTVHQGSGQTVPINYSLYRNHGKWLVYDVSVDGISLLSSYRSSFNDEIQQSSINQLIARLEKHVQAKEKK